MQLGSNLTAEFRVLFSHCLVQQVCCSSPRGGIFNSFWFSDFYSRIELGKQNSVCSTTFLFHALFLGDLCFWYDWNRISLIIARNTEYQNSVALFSFLKHWQWNLKLYQRWHECTKLSWADNIKFNAGGAANYSVCFGRGECFAIPPQFIEDFMWCWHSLFTQIIQT